MFRASQCLFVPMQLLSSQNKCGQNLFKMFNHVSINMNSDGLEQVSLTQNKNSAGQKLSESKAVQDSSLTLQIDSAVICIFESTYCLFLPYSFL